MRMGMSRRTMAKTSLAALAAACAHEPRSEIVVSGGPIYTGVTERVEAVRISNGRFAAVGALADVASPGARRIDLVMWAPVAEYGR